LQTFRSRREWIDHEFQVHRVNQQWCCNLCKEVLGTQEVFRAHIENIHQSTFFSSQIEEFISASKRFVSRNGSDEKCPFCLTAPSQTQRSFASHVGRHLQEISLAALPLLDASSDDEDGSDSSGDNNDDDGNGSGDEGSGDREKRISALSGHSDEETDQHDSGEASSPLEMGGSGKISSAVETGEHDVVLANNELEVVLPIPQVVKGVTDLLATLKVLWATLEHWSMHQATAAQASYAYVKVEYEFNIVCQNFIAAEIDFSDFGNVPELLRHILDAAVTQESSGEAREECLPNLRKIYVPLVNGLKQKLQVARKKQSPHEEEVYHKTQHDLVPKLDRPKINNLEWEALYTDFETKQKAFLEQIEAKQSIVVSPNQAASSLPRPGQIFQAGCKWQSPFPIFWFDMGD
jgi:hypothetical protein